MPLPRWKSLLLCFASASLLIAAPPAQAAVIIGGSGLIDATYANQLEAWLGEGTIEITRIYAKASGDTSSAFHSAVDGQGRTFSVIQVLESQNNIAYFPNAGGAPVNVQQQIIGGYNPQSWSSIGGYNITPNDIDRTAFLFNLTSTEIQRQDLIGQGYNVGDHQTINHPAYGPTFGAGADLYVDSSLSSGLAYNFSYGGTSFVDNIVIGGGYYTTDLQYGQIEVFTIRNVAASVPEPLSLLSWSAFALLGFAGPALRRRKK